jgi:hypothetical protein
MRASSGDFPEAPLCGFDISPRARGPARVAHPRASPVCDVAALARRESFPQSCPRDRAPTAGYVSRGSAPGARDASQGTNVEDAT